jgi:hypothetical protein
MLVCYIFLIGYSVEMESLTMCDYTNYHVFMFVVCGMIAMLLMLTALFLVWRYGRFPYPDETELCERFAWWALVFLTLMTGFEGALALFYICIVSVLLYKFLSFCVQEIWHATRFVLHQIRFPVVRRSNAVGASMDPEVSIPQIVVVRWSSADEFTIQLDDLQPRECPICLESGEVNRWVTTQCGHVFHVECISRWNASTCPLCRRRAWK